MKWYNTSLGNRILLAQTMANNAEKYLEPLGSWGITQEKLDKMKQLIADIEVIRSERDNAKNEWQNKTELLNKSMKELYDDHYSVIKKVVKMEYTNPKWKSFGIEDKK